MWIFYIVEHIKFNNFNILNAIILLLLTCYIFNMLTKQEFVYPKVQSMKMKMKLKHYLLGLWWNARRSKEDAESTWGTIAKCTHAEGRHNKRSKRFV